jgi:hypothetical protein
VLQSCLGVFSAVSPTRNRVARATTDGSYF